MAIPYYVSVLCILFAFSHWTCICTYTFFRRVKKHRVQKKNEQKRTHIELADSMRSTYRTHFLWFFLFDSFLHYSFAANALLKHTMHTYRFSFFPENISFAKNFKGFHTSRTMPIEDAQNNYWIYSIFHWTTKKKKENPKNFAKIQYYPTEIWYGVKHHCISCRRSCCWCISDHVLLFVHSKTQCVTVAGDKIPSS